MEKQGCSYSLGSIPEWKKNSIHREIAPLFTGAAVGLTPPRASSTRVIV